MKNTLFEPKHRVALLPPSLPFVASGGDTSPLKPTEITQTCETVQVLDEAAQKRKPPEQSRGFHLTFSSVPRAN